MAWDIPPIAEDEGGAPGEKPAEKNSSALHELGQTLLWGAQWADRHSSFVQAVFAGLIVLLTGAYVCFTISLARSTRKAANAAEQNARILMEAERAYVRVEVVEPGLRAEGEGKIRTSGRFRYQCINAGRVAAQIEEFYASYVITEKGSNPNPIAPETRGRRLPTGTIATIGSPHEEGENLLAVYDMMTLLADDAWQTKQIWFYGFVVYSDKLGHRTKNGFCFEFEPLGNRWRRLLGDEYNHNKAVEDYSPPY